MTIPSLSSSYNFLERENHWQYFWAQQKLYSWNPTCTREDTFVIDTPPPTISGNLHLGHAFSYTQTDFIVRFQRMLGKNIFYPIGFDDNGLPTERLVEKKKGIRPIAIGRERFVALCQEVVEEEEKKFRSLFKAMALSIDWDLEYQTINPLSCKLAQMSFLSLLKKGEVYRSEQPMLWDPVDHTALAQADVEEKERASFMNDILFYHEHTHAPLPIATTRPELLPACVALFYHPNDTRYQHLANSFALTPLFSIKVPILSDELVQPDKGTGLVMCCTFGDQTDIIWWKKHQLPTKIIISKQGILSGDHAGPLKGLKVEAAREKIIEILKEKDLLVKQKEILQSVKCGERSGAPLEFLTTPQWFVHVLPHKEEILAKAHTLKWYPPIMKQQLITWINGIAWDWCISRQRYFGVPFPIWYSKRTGEEGKWLFPTLEQLPVNPLEDLPIGYSRQEVEPDYDVMDTWATSSISPQLSSHAIDKDFYIDYTRHRKLFPMDLRTQSHEIIRTWTFYTLLKAHLHEKTIPWKKIMVSGWCLASNKEKMSKSKGNIILPETILNQYGADVIRYWAAGTRLGADTYYCDHIMKKGKRLITKLWNAGKFISCHFSKLNQQIFSNSFETNQIYITHTVDKWLLYLLSDLMEQVETYFVNFNYAEALESIEKFFWSLFCDDYLEISKARAYNANATTSDNQGPYSAIITLYHAFYCILQLFAPILPHITEELAQGLYPHRGSIHQKGIWPTWKLPTIFLTPFQINQIDQFREILHLVRKSKADQQLSIKVPIQQLSIETNETLLDNDLLEDLKKVTVATKVVYNTDGSILPGLQMKGKYCSIYLLL